MMTAYYVVDHNSTLHDGQTYIDPATGQNYTVINIDSTKDWLGNYNHEDVNVANSTDTYLLSNTLTTNVNFTTGTSTHAMATTVDLQAPTGTTSPTYSVSFSDPSGSGSLQPTINVPTNGNLSGVTLNDPATDGLTVHVGAGARIGNITSGTESTDNFTLTAGDGAHVGNISAGGSSNITLGNNVTAGTITTSSSNDVLTIGEHTTVSAIDLGSGDNFVSVGNSATTGTISTGSGVDSITIGTGAHTGAITTSDGNDKLTVGTGATTGNIDSGSGNNVITVGDGAKTGTVTSHGGEDTLNIGANATTSGIDVGSGNNVINIGPGSHVGAVTTWGGNDTVNIGANVTTGDVYLGNGSDSLTLGDNATVGGISMAVGGYTGDTIVGGSNVTVNGNITQATGDHYSKVYFEDSLTLNGHVDVSGGRDTFSVGSGSTITGYINMGSDLSADDADHLIVGTGSEVGGYINTENGADYVGIGDRVTLKGGWDAINTNQGSDTLVIGQDVSMTNSVNMGISLPNDDLLTISYGPGGEAAFKKALADQGYSDPDGDGQYTNSSSGNFVWGGNTYEHVNFINGILCFAAGTRIMTDRGTVAIETLSAGDLVVTRDNGLQAIRWIGSRRLDAAQLAAAPNLRPVRIRRHALGTNIPSADLVVSPQHRVLVRSVIAQKMFGAPEVLVAAKQLVQVDGVDIAEDMAEVTYFHMLFDRHEVVISNGAETESLYTGPEALKTVGPAALAEIFAIFPELAEADYTPVAVRPLASGRMGRKLAVRHAQNHKALVN